MSLINKMLQDLQQQKDHGRKQNHLQPKVMERIPYLPRPVIFGGGALLVLCFIWWLAGALSDLMFDIDPGDNPEPARQVEMVEQSPSRGAENLVAEADQLTEEERTAEAPVVSAASAPKTESKPEPKPGKIQPVVKGTAAKPKSIATSSSKHVAATQKTTSLTAKKQHLAAPANRDRRLVQSSLASAKSQPTVSVLHRLHPDDLPGAVLDANNTQLEKESLAPRPDRKPASTPYGMAQQAYLDGKWARVHERNSLAERSLREALELYPGHLPARELLAEMLEQEGNTGEAMLVLEDGLAIAPDYAVFKKRYARILEGQGDYDAAIKVMLKGGMPPVEKDPEAHVILASLYQHLDEQFLAAQTYRNLLVAWPEAGAFWVGLGGVLEKQNLPKDAVLCYQKALETKNLRHDLVSFAQKRLALLN